MKESVIRKLEGLLERNEEVLALLSDADVIADQDRFRACHGNMLSLKMWSKALRLPAGAGGSANRTGDAGRGRS